MTYTIKGKIKRFLELTLVGKDKMVKDIAETLTNPEIEDGVPFSRNNIYYKAETVTNGYPDLETYYVFWRNSKSVMRFGINSEEEFVNDVTDTELLYRTWKELV